MSSKPFSRMRKLSVVLPTRDYMSDPSLQSFCQQMVLKERKQLAADIHDTLCQSLSAIILQLQAAEEELPHNLDIAQRHIRRAHELAGSSVGEARRTIWRLFHDSSEEEDLATALSLLAKDLLAETPLKLELLIPKMVRSVRPDIRLLLLHVGREAVTNVVKHAHANNVRIELLYKKREALLCVYDDGLGIHNSAAPRDCFGITSMRQGAESQGGTLLVQSQPGKGTRVMARVPLD